MITLQWKQPKAQAIQKSIDRHSKKLVKQKFGVPVKKFSGIVTARIISIHDSACDKDSKTISINPIRKNKKCKRNTLFLDNVAYQMLLKKSLIWYAIACKKLFKIRHKDNHIVDIKIV